jgi:hypothetical protein
MFYEIIAVLVIYKSYTSRFTVVRIIEVKITAVDMRWFKLIT